MVAGFVVALLSAAFTSQAAEEMSMESATPTADRAALTLIDDVIARYEAATTYRLTFRQETRWALADTTFVSNGVLLLKQPSMLSINYDDGSRVVADGESVWVYVAQTNQFLAASVDSNDVVIDPPRLLRQYAPDPSGKFPTTTPAAPEGLTSDAKTTIALSLKPRGGVGEPAFLDVYVDRSSNLVRQIVARARSGDMTTYTVEKTELNVPTKPSQFTLRKPAGAERLTEEGAGLE